MKVQVTIEGDFESYDEAADAVEEVAGDLREGTVILSQPGDANPKVFIIVEDVS